MRKNKGEVQCLGKLECSKHGSDYKEGCSQCEEICRILYGKSVKEWRKG